MHQDLKALKSFTYAGRALQVGDAFRVSRRDARVLIAVGRAALADTYQTTSAVAAVTKGAAQKPATEKLAPKKPAAKKTKAPAK